MKENRCRKCKALLFKGEAKYIEIKCRKCGFIQAFGDVKFKPENKKANND